MTTYTVADLPADTRLHHATRAKAVKLDAALRAEYPALTLTAETHDDTETVAAWTVAHMDGEEPIYTGAKVPDLADLLDAAMDAGLDPEAKPEDEEADDEPKASGSVVPEHYRQQYKAASTNGQSCGDWLAEWLLAETHGVDGLNVHDLTAVFVANGLDLSTGWGRLPESGQKGWVGRYRMNGRQVLEKAVAQWGVVRKANGEAVTPPQDFLDTLRGKHSKWLAKEAKRHAEALASMGKQEGEAAAA